MQNIANIFSFLDHYFLVRHNSGRLITKLQFPVASEVPVGGLGAGEEKPDLSLNVNLAINESRPSTPSSAPQTPLREPNRPRFTKTIDPWGCERELLFRTNASIHTITLI